MGIEGVEIQSSEQHLICTLRAAKTIESVFNLIGFAALSVLGYMVPTSSGNHGKPGKSRKKFEVELFQNACWSTSMLI